LFPLTGANAGAALALAVALTATSFAVAGLPTNSVGTDQIKKHAVHKSDIAKGAVSVAKLAPGVARMDAFAGGLAGSVPPSTPDLSLATTTITTTATARIFAYGRGSFQVTCLDGSDTVRAGLYLDGHALAASGTSIAPGASPAELNLFGMTSAAVGAGTHTLEIKSDCSPGTFLSSTTTGDAALGAFAVHS
jgi:hypothetical protein